MNSETVTEWVPESGGEEKQAEARNKTNFQFLIMYNTVIIIKIHKINTDKRFT